jgi:membrane dipeptidase
VSYDSILQSTIRNPHFFDAHCDTVMRVFDGGLDFVAGHGRAHVDLPRLLTAGYCVQLFAIFAPKSQYPDRDLRTFADDIIAVITGWVEASGERMRLVTGAGQIRDMCTSDNVVGALLGMEGADPLECRAENLAHFHRAGLRSLIPAWSDNAFSGTCMGSGGPLTEEGAKLIELAEALRVMVDVSHLSDAAFEQVCRITRRPFVASHSNCREICPSPRNLTDEQIRALAARGGVMGVNLSADFLAPDYMVLWDAIAGPAYAAARQISDPAAKRQIRDETRAKLVQIPLPPAGWITRHVRHAIEVGGEECIGLGGDLDGITTMPIGIIGAESYPAIAELLSAAGLTAAQVEKVCWRNMARVYAEVLG